jgi:hypothetical protein
MKRIFVFVGIAAVLLLSAPATNAQGTISDYERVA